MEQEQPKQIDRDRDKKQALFKNCILFNDCKTKINNTRDNANDLDIVMPMHNLIEYCDNQKHHEVYTNFVEMSQKIL